MLRTTVVGGLLAVHAWGRRFYYTGQWPPCLTSLACYPSVPLQSALASMLLFNRMDKATQKKIVQEVYERPVCVGDILIQQGDVGAAASQLYIVKHGKFEVGGCVWQPAPSNTHSVVSTM